MQYQLDIAIDISLVLAIAGVCKLHIFSVDDRCVLYAKLIYS